MECLYIQSTNPAAGVNADTLSGFISSNSVSKVFLPNTYNTTGVQTSAQWYPVASKETLPNGPYVLTLSSDESVLGLTAAYGLHEDHFEAFMSGSIPVASSPDEHLTLQVSIPGTRMPAIIVPSRISSAVVSDPGPLAGLRFAVKDIFHVKGLKTSGGSRAYYQVYGPQNYTTETVEKSLAGGAQLIGKTRTIAFALGAPNNGKEIDYSDPWNPRGDGYLTTGGSSSGSGSAVTAYDWVDFTIGSDTGGSVRFPARFGGLYGYKPTHGIFNLTGILVAIAEQDTPGFLTRSPSIFTKLGKWWAKDTPLEEAAEQSSFPSNLLYYADEPKLTQPAAEAMKLQFFANVSSALNMSTSSVNVTQTWLETGLSSNQSISTYMTNVYSDQNSIQFYEQIGKELEELYSAYNNGSHFPSDPPVNGTWYDALNETTIARYPESARKREVFGQWWNENIAKASDATCSESFFAHSYHSAPGTEKITFRPNGVVSYYYNGVWANYAGIPEIVVPIGQIKYLSPYTLREEWQPVTVAFAAAKGCDLKLFELVEKLESVGLLKETLPGKVAYYTDEVW